MVDKLIGEILNVASYGGILAIVIGLCEWAISFFYRAITDKLGGRR